MGCSSSQQTRKEGVSLTEIEGKIKPLDLVVNRSDGWFQSAIRALTMCSNSETEEIYNHVGIIVTSEILDLPEVKPGKLYILEAVNANTEILDVKGDISNGVVLRDFESTMAIKGRATDNFVAWVPLNLETPRANYREAFTRFYYEHIGRPYEGNYITLTAGPLDCFRPLRDLIDDPQAHFCSEIVVRAYQSLGILPPEINPGNVLPQDLAYPEGDSDQPGIPLNLVHRPVRFTLSH